MKLTDLRGLCRALPVCLAVLILAACHDTGELEPLADQKIYVSDRFYDIALLGPKHAIVVGYKGKVLETTDAGVSWKAVDSGTKEPLFSIGFADDKVGWIVGQAGTVLRTEDGGGTWKPQDARAYMGDDCRETNGADEECNLAPLFSLSVIDANNAVAIGDRSTVIKTSDGGKSWKVYTLRYEGLDQMDLNSLLAFEDPVLYDVQFFDPNNGFVVGEFGKIYRTSDGGETWIEKQASLVGAEYFDVLDLPTFFDVEFRDRQVGYVAGLEARVAQTTDGGETWAWRHHGVEEYSSPFYSSDILPNGSVWTVGASGQLVIAPDGNEFSQGTLGTQVNNWIREIEFFDNDNGWVIGGFGFIMNTNDGGKTWFRRIG